MGAHFIDRFLVLTGRIEIGHHFGARLKIDFAILQHRGTQDERDQIGTASECRSIESTCSPMSLSLTALLTLIPSRAFILSGYRPVRFNRRAVFDLLPSQVDV